MGATGAFLRKYPEHADEKPSRNFVSDEIAAHLGEQELAILAEAEVFQDWGRKQQLPLFETPREDSDGILAWLKAVFAAGNAKYGDRWSAGISTLQAHGRLLPEDASGPAQVIGRLHGKLDAVTASYLGIVGQDDSFDAFFEADIMAGQRIATRARLASIQDHAAPVDEVVRTAVGEVRKDILGQ